MSARLVAVALAALLVGSIFRYDLVVSSFSTEPGLVELRLAPLGAGAVAGTDGTNGTVSLTGTLALTTTDLFWINNTNASAPWYVKLELTSSSGVANLAAATLGVNNGTANSAQVTALLGSLTQTSGSYARIDPGASGRVYLSQVVSALGVPSTLATQVRVTQETNETTLVTYTLAVNVV